jgi:peptide/nickel transport system substrate-binding protein
MSALHDLIQIYARGAISRRGFLARASALGVSSALAGVIAGNPRVFAQEATPAAAGADSNLPPGGAADTITFSAFNVDQAPLNIRNGDMDVYLFGLKTAGANDLEGDPDVRLVQAPASTLSLILNPAPAAEGDLNPFSIPEVRQAMQYLVDRSFIASDIYQGRALPMLTNITPLEYDQLTLFPLLSATDIRYDPEYANQQISDAMTAAGATLENNIWSIGGRPITLKFIIRVEDERRDTGDLIRAALEGAGFQVQPLYQQFAPAILTVQTTDPKTFQWHLYTEGWVTSAPARYDDGGINAYYAPWLGNMPGWQIVGYWQYENQELDDLGKRLYRGQFTSQDERDDIYRQMAQLGLQESVRVWLVTALQSFPVRKEVENLSLDLTSGPNSFFALRGADVQGSDTLRAGHLWVWTERTTWNPVGGFSDAYSSAIVRQINDPALVTHPFTGLPQTFRADYTLETAGPSNTLEVPADAVKWDVASKTWAPVGDGVTAVSKVVFDYSGFIGKKFHHGVEITMADVIYPLQQSFEFAYDEAKVQIETAIGITSRPVLETYKAFRLTDDHTLEVYVDYWHFDESYIASYATPSGVGSPWELLAAMDDVVFTKRQGAYTDSAAARFSVPWLSLVLERDARTVLRSVQAFKRSKAVPAGVFEIGGQSLVTPEEATARFEALETWFDANNMLVIGQGPYMLTKYDPPAQFAELTAFRNETYPFTAADFRYGEPPNLSIQPITPPDVVLGDPIEVPVTVEGPGTLSLQYAFVDPAAGEVLATGPVEGESGSFTVTIDASVTGGLFPGLYQLFLLASSDAIAEVAESRVDLQVGV